MLPVDSWRGVNKDGRADSSGSRATKRQNISSLMAGEGFSPDGHPGTLPALLRTVHHRILHDMIRSFRHKGLEAFYAWGSLAGIQAQHAKRLRMLLAALDTAQAIGDMDIPGFRLHPLQGTEKGRWSIRVNANWRLTFDFHDGHAYVLDYEDYH